MTIGSATVVVLGDIGHSPRTCYHAHSLAERDIYVDLVGYKGSIPHEKIRSHKNINLVYIPSPPKFQCACLPGPILLLFKFIFMSFALLWGLLFKCRWCTSLIILQNPPGIPTMLICYAISVLKRAALATDWHNYTHTILAQNFPKRTSNSFKRRLEDCFVNWAHKWEGFFGRHSNISVCVSNAMRKDLKKRWGINALTLHDKPPMWNFMTVNTEQKHDLFYRLFSSGAFEGYFTDMDDADQYDEETIFTTKKNNKCSLRLDRPLLLVSSTSWTEDEDFGLLLDALVGYSKHTELTLASASACYLPKIFVVITGKGPQKKFYMDKIPTLHLKNVEVVTAWLAPEDYPRLLASADIGVSLHTSSSGLDLPMKIVDMFGCGLPVLAKRFPAIDEQVQDGINGRLFDTANQLKSFIIEIAGEFVENKANLTLRKNLASSGRSDWHSQWEASLWPVLHKFFRKQIEANERWARFERHEEDEKEGEERHVKGDDDMSRSIDTIANDYDVLGNTDEDLDVQINPDSETNSD
ncbi:unnamed protein product [Bursaphelenchus xylophilus]|uniref:(pine wood nematode) hypothetical protein n=1 Tax=Bursaphelenchus xylophilus TaxID=6326 RepID=A0A1I7S012_BURXY|nr:unnamed protein product [Bursaphelenchus xylophilus]CAG9109094.1 unnamed protein product [Bursaphelenchus xylophilus]